MTCLAPFTTAAIHVKYMFAVIGDLDSRHAQIQCVTLFWVSSRNVMNVYENMI